MDDELPIFIYCSTQINTKNAPAEYHMIEDYIKYSNINLDESKVLTNSIGAILYISKEWDVKKYINNSNLKDKKTNEKHKDNKIIKKEIEENEEKSEDHVFLEDLIKDEEHKLK